VHDHIGVEGLLWQEAVILNEVKDQVRTAQAGLWWT
jgi:hypothetical protein